MAYTFGGGSSVNDIYTDSTATVGVDSIVAGESLKLDSNGNLLMNKKIITLIVLFSIFNFVIAGEIFRSENHSFSIAPSSLFFV